MSNRQYAINAGLAKFIQLEKTEKVKDITSEWSLLLTCKSYNEVRSLLGRAYCEKKSVELGVPCVTQEEIDDWNFAGTFIRDHGNMAAILDPPYKELFVAI